MMTWLPSVRSSCTSHPPKALQLTDVFSGGGVGDGARGVDGRGRAVVATYGVAVSSGAVGLGDGLDTERGEVEAPQATKTIDIPPTSPRFAQITWLRITTCC